MHSWSRTTNRKNLKDKESGLPKKWNMRKKTRKWKDQRSSRPTNFSNMKRNWEITMRARIESMRGWTTSHSPTVTLSKSSVRSSQSSRKPSCFKPSARTRPRKTKFTKSVTYARLNSMLRRTPQCFKQLGRASLLRIWVRLWKAARTSSSSRTTAQRRPSGSNRTLSKTKMAVWLSTATRPLWIKRWDATWTNFKCLTTRKIRN